MGPSTVEKRLDHSSPRPKAASGRAFPSLPPVWLGTAPPLPGGPRCALAGHRPPPGLGTPVRGDPRETRNTIKPAGEVLEKELS